jgi:hypothetical protein
MSEMDVYDSLRQFILDLIDSEGIAEWQKAELNIKIQPGMLGMSGNCTTAKRVVSLRTRFSKDLQEKVIGLHQSSTQEGFNRWNKAKFSLFPHNEFELAFIWDQAYQDEIDYYNKQSELEDPSYRAPKWDWEKE